MYMGYRTETSAPFPCACGKGTIRFSYKEHDVYVSLNNPWELGEIDCPECGALYALDIVGDGWYFVPKDLTSGFAKIRAHQPK